MHLNKFFLTSLIVLLISVALVYFPSLSGGFVYDDFWSLQKLSEINGMFSWESLSAYLISSDTGPLKRPISMLTFLIDAQDWPADPYSFRVTNLVIHFFNSLLLFYLLFSLLKIKESEKSVWVALIATMLWMLHPFLVSTVAYVVQRMAMLPVFFSLLSMLLYLRVRLKYQELSFFRSSFYLSFIIYVFALLAALSKENGILILLYIPLFEYFICQKYLNLTPMKKHARRVFTLLPVVLMLSAVLIKLPDFYQSYAYRDFGLIERLMSESRALVKYLYHWMVPGILTEGIYTDTFKASTSLLNPISTLYSMICIGGLVLLSLIIRNRIPLLSFAILFYFTSHLIESTVIPLQLYFEHRNYSAFLFLSLPLVIAVLNVIENKKLVFSVFFALVVVLLSQTYLRSTLWGNSTQLKIKTLETFPESIRARIGVVEMLYNKSNYQNALILLEQGIEMQEAAALIAFRLKIKCKYEDVSEKEVQQLTDALVRNGLKEQELSLIGSFLQTILNDECAQSDDKLEYVEKILATISSQLKPDSPLGRSMYYYASGRLAHKKMDYKRSADFFIKSFLQDKDYERVIMSVSQLLNSGEPELALYVLEIAALEYKSGYILNVRLENEIDRFLNTTKEEIAAKNEDVDHNPSEK